MDYTLSILSPVNFKQELTGEMMRN